MPYAYSEKLATLTSVHKRNSEIGEWWEKVFFGQGRREGKNASPFKFPLHLKLCANPGILLCISVCRIP